MPEKICSKCKERKLVSEFPANKRNSDGHLGYCYKCRRLSQKVWQDKNKEHVREYSRSWFKKNRRRYVEKTNEASRIYRKTHLLETRARINAQHAITLAGRKCSVCGTKECLQRHHFDYHRPLEVKILCVGCHTKEHKQCL